MKMLISTRGFKCFIIVGKVNLSNLHITSKHLWLYLSPPNKNNKKNNRYYDLYYFSLDDSHTLKTDILEYYEK